MEHAPGVEMDGLQQKQVKEEQVFPYMCGTDSARIHSLR